MGGDYGLLSRSIMPVSAHVPAHRRGNYHPRAAVHRCVAAAGTSQRVSQLYPSALCYTVLERSEPACNATACRHVTMSLVLYCTQPARCDPTLIRQPGISRAALCEAHLHVCTSAPCHKCFPDLYCKPRAFSIGERHVSNRLYLCASGVPLYGYTGTNGHLAVTSNVPDTAYHETRRRRTASVVG